MLRFDEVDAPEPGPGEVQIDVEAITIDFNDIDGIRGRYRTVPVKPPYIPGMEVLGRVRGAGKFGEALIGTAWSARFPPAPSADTRKLRSRPLR